MGHRYMFRAPQTLETERDQGWNHAEQPYMRMARPSASEGSSLVHSCENINIHGGQFPYPCTPAPMSRAEWPRYQAQAPAPSHDPFLHQSAGGSFDVVPDNYYHLPSSSSPGGQTVPGVHGRFYSQTMGSGTGPYKRKRPSTPQPYDRGSTSRYYDVGSSSNLQLPAYPWQEKQNSESYHMPWECHGSYGVNGLSIARDGTQRNVRSRAGVNLEPNLAGAHFSSNSWHHFSSNRSSDQSNLADFWGQTSNTPARESNSYLVHDGHRATFHPGSSFYGHGPNTLNALNNYANCSMESGGYSTNASVPQNANSYWKQSLREMQSSYDRRSVPVFRTLSSNFYPGQVAASGEGSQMTAESYPSRHSQAFSTIAFHDSEWNGRTGVSSDRYRSFTEEASVLDRVTQEDHMVMDYSTFYGSRALFDQHRDMRLDIDNMSYEELLVLEETIGSVSTGLSDGLISKCLAQSIYSSSDKSEDDGRCVICLEEYEDNDDVGTLKCGHDFHAGCIRKWLYIKNLCPVCKACAIDESMKEKLST